MQGGGGEKGVPLPGWGLVEAGLGVPLQVYVRDPGSSGRGIFRAGGSWAGFSLISWGEKMSHSQEGQGDMTVLAPSGEQKLGAALGKARWRWPGTRGQQEGVPGRGPSTS